MRQRCENPRRKDYPKYGGRGIRVCSQWLQFETFFADMGEAPDGLTIERRNVDGHYEPDNCCWATPAEQARNRHTSKLTADGVAAIRAAYAAGKLQREVAAEFGVNQTMVSQIIRGKVWR